MSLFTRFSVDNSGMKKFAYYVDGVLSKIVCFFMGAVIAGYYVRGLIALFAFAVTFSLCVSEVYMHVLYGRKPKENFAGLDAVKAKFCYESDRVALDYFFTALSEKRTVVREGKFIGVGEVAFFCRLKPVSPAPDYVVDAAALAASRGYERVIIAAFVVSPEAAATASEISCASVRILDGAETARLLSSLGALPDYEPKAKVRKPIKTVFAAALSKGRANAYIFASVLLFVFSRFVRHSIYYIVAAVALFALGIVVRFIPRTSKKGKTRA